MGSISCPLFRKQRAVFFPLSKCTARKGLIDQSQKKPKNMGVKTRGGVEWYDKHSEKTLVFVPKELLTHLKTMGPAQLAALLTKHQWSLAMLCTLCHWRQMFFSREKAKCTAWRVQGDAVLSRSVYQASLFLGWRVCNIYAIRHCRKASSRCNFNITIINEHWGRSLFLLPHKVLIDSDRKKAAPPGFENIGTQSVQELFFWW